jgi:hypothetical protein
MKQNSRLGLAFAGTIFAATMMVVTGIFQAINGIEAIVRGRFYIISSNYLYDLSTTAWGWVHLILGALLVLCGLMLYGGFAWAAVTGIALAVLTAVDNFFFLPYYPIWSLVTIAASVFVIWSLATALSAGPGAGREERREAGAEPWPTTNAPSGQRTSRHAASDAPAPHAAPPADPTPTTPGTTGERQA